MKKMDDEGSYSQLTVLELKTIILHLPDDTEVKIRTCHNLCGNIVEAGNAEMSSYGFFGKSIPCLIIEPAYVDHITDPDTRKERLKIN